MDKYEINVHTRHTYHSDSWRPLQRQVVVLGGIHEVLESG